jgi:protein-tyrosine phosphatase
MTESALDFALLKGARNFRAVQPYKAADGRTLRAETIYRSGELSRLDEDDLAVIEALRIKLVCDLRTAREQAEFVSRWPETHSPARLDLTDRAEHDAGPHKIFELIERHPGEAGGLRAMEALYRRKPRVYLSNILSLFETIVAGDALPLLIHCHAGKDRTGFIIAMILAAVGVSHEDIIEDYVTTVKYFPVAQEARGMIAWAERTYGKPLELASAIPMVDARRDYLEAAFEEIAKGWGDFAGYFRAAGVDDAMRARLREMLLV